MLIFLLVFLSGFTGLIYQVTWHKYLSVMLGSHSQAAALVLALFFFFLSIGYELFGRFSARISRDRLIQYAGLEFIIGMYALYSPQLFYSLFESYSKQSASIWVSIIYSGAFIAIPTILMGGTIPVLTQGLSKSFEASSKTHSFIYAVNTFGAFVGVILGGFYLIEEFGLPGTLTLTGDLNILIGALAAAIAVKSRFSFTGPETLTESGGDASWLKTLPLFAVSFLSGFYVFTTEKLIIRLAGLSAGSSVYAYSIVVAAFILAIGTGGLVLTRFERWISRKLVVGVLVGTFGSLVLTYLSVQQWPTWIMRVRFLFQPAEINFTPFWLTVLIFFSILLIIPVGLMGANLPMLFGVVRQRGTDLSTSVGRLYAVNCIGATLGAILGGYLAFVYFEAYEVFKLTLLLVALAGAISIALLFQGRRRKVVPMLYLAICIALVGLLQPWPKENFTPGRHLITAAPVTGYFSEFLSTFPPVKIIFERFDPNTYVSVTETKTGDRGLYVNGKPDAFTGGDNFTRAMAAITPISIAPAQVSNIFIVGLGAGLSTAVASKYSEVQRVKVAEISSGVVEALPFFKKFNLGLDERMNKVEIVVGDAYKVLLSDRQTYDLIICEPSNPWVAGIEKLYSTEFYRMARNRLTEDGLFAQWFPMYTTDQGTVLSILKTFTINFPYVTVWSARGGALTLIGSKKPLSPSTDLLNSRFAEQKEMYQKFKFDRADTVLTAQLLTDFELRSLLDPESKVNSVYDPMLEFRAGRSYFSGQTVGMDQLRLTRLPLPIPSSLKRDALFYKVKGLTTADSFSAAKEILQSNFLARLKLLLHLFSEEPGAGNLKSEYKLLQDYRYLLGLTDIFIEEEGWSERVTDLAIKVRQLNAIGESPKLGKLTYWLEKHKPTEQYPATLYKVVNQLASQESLKKLTPLLSGQENPTSADLKLLTSAFDEIVKTYKILEAY